MSAVSIVERLLKADAKISASVEIGFVPQPKQAPFIVLTHVYEEQRFLAAGATTAFKTRVSVAILATTAIECDRLAAAVIDAIGFTKHQNVRHGTTTWKDVSILKAGNDTL